jgi:hypothetical protein
MLREKLIETVDTWPDYLAGGKVDHSSRTYQLVCEAIPSVLRGWNSEIGTRLVEGSTGRGNVTHAPWVATFDPRVSFSATEGYYPVYLYSIDLERLYLSISYGVTAFTELFGQGSRCLERLDVATAQARRYAAVPFAAIQSINGLICTASSPSM